MSIEDFRRLDDEGREVLDQTPIALRVKRRVVTDFEDIRKIIRREISDAASRGGAETFEEANDFDVDDEVDFTSPHEYTADQEAEDREAIEAHKQAELERAVKANDARAELGRGTGGGAPTSRPARAKRTGGGVRASGVNGTDEDDSSDE